MTDAELVLAQDRFIEEFAKHGVVSRACRDAQVWRTTYYRWLQLYPAFAERVLDALEQANDAIREEAHTRAIEGWDEPVYQKGGLVGYIRKKSDAVLLKMMAARLPEYRALAERGQVKGEESSNEPRRVEVTIREVSDWDSVTRVRS